MVASCIDAHCIRAKGGRHNIALTKPRMLQNGALIAIDSRGDVSKTNEEV